MLSAFLSLPRFEIRNILLVPKLMVIVYVHRVLNRRDSKHQITVSGAVLCNNKSGVRIDQSFVLQHPHIFHYRVFTFADSLTDCFEARVAGERPTILTPQKKSIDRYFLCRQPKIKDDIRHRKEIFDGQRAVILSVL